ncbi:MAG TPA: hypothetical protein VGD02_10800, partial [Gemmatimonadaceae bacterium]
RQEARRLTLPPNSLDSTLSVIGNLVAHAPSASRETRTVCADVILMHVELQRGDVVHTAQEECPHRDRKSAAYWARLDSLFRALVPSAAK